MDRQVELTKTKPCHKVVAVQAGLPSHWPRPPMRNPFRSEVQVGASTIIDYEFDWGRDGIHCSSCNFMRRHNSAVVHRFEGNLWIGVRRCGAARRFLAGRW
ncbi:MAG: hypothetical protein U1F20_06885 [Lysobacterales bacterium]